MAKAVTAIQLTPFKSMKGSTELDVTGMRADYVITDDKIGSSDRANVKLDDLDPAMTIGDLWKIVVDKVTTNETAEAHAARAALAAEISTLEEQLKVKKAQLRDGSG